MAGGSGLGVGVGLVERVDAVCVCKRQVLGGGVLVAGSPLKPKEEIETELSICNLDFGRPLVQALC